MPDSDGAMVWLNCALAADEIVELVRKHGSVSAEKEGRKQHGATVLLQEVTTRLSGRKRATRRERARPVGRVMGAEQAGMEMPQCIEYDVMLHAMS